MQLAARVVTALALLAFASPALPCGDRAAKTVTASSEKPTAEKAAPAGAVAKSSKKAKGETKPAAAPKQATAAN